VIAKELQERLSKAKQDYDRLRHAAARARRGTPCLTYESHVFHHEDGVAGSDVGSASWFKRNHIRNPKKGCWCGFNVWRCLVCGERYLTDYAAQNPIKLKLGQKVSF
jgi:hypothetical protein